VLPARASDSPTNGHGYIQFEINDELPVEVARRQRPIEQTVTRSRTETVNEVLSNLFPKGFSDIFRLSGNTEPSTSAPTTTTTVSLSFATRTRNWQVARKEHLKIPTRRTAKVRFCAIRSPANYNCFNRIEK